MQRLASLPERLRYLQPFRKKFASLPPEELNEDTGMTPLFELIKKRINGLSDDEAEKLLDEDISVLQDWLAAPENANDCLHFAAGVVYFTSPGDLVKHIREESKKKKLCLPSVEMDLWAGIKPRRFEKEGDGGMLVKWKRLLFAIDVLDDATAAKGEKPAALSDLRDQVTSSSVRFGEVKGTKYVVIGENRFGRPDKRIIYVLAVPGGHVEVSIIFIGKKPGTNWDESQWKEYARIDNSNWNESPVESFLHTLRIVVKEPSNG